MAQQGEELRLRLEREQRAREKAGQERRSREAEADKEAPPAAPVKESRLGRISASLQRLRSAP